MDARNHAVLPGPWTTTARAMLMGALSGLRALTPIAHLARVAREHELVDGLGGPWPVLRRMPVRALLRLAMLGELVIDKLPGIPSRLSAPALGGRIATGAVSGAAVFASARRPPWAGAVLGAAGAYAGAVAGHRLRVGRDTHEHAHLFRGFVEDVVAVRASSRAVRALPIASAV